MVYKIFSKYDPCMFYFIFFSDSVQSASFNQRTPQKNITSSMVEEFEVKRDRESLLAFRGVGGLTPDKRSKINKVVLNKFVHRLAKIKSIDLMSSFPNFEFWKEMVLLYGPKGMRLINCESDKYLRKAWMNYFCDGKSSGHRLKRCPFCIEQDLLNKAENQESQESSQLSLTTAAETKKLPQQISNLDQESPLQNTNNQQVSVIDVNSNSANDVETIGGEAEGKLLDPETETELVRVNYSSKDDKFCSICSKSIKKKNYRRHKKLHELNSKTGIACPYCTRLQTRIKEHIEGNNDGRGCAKKFNHLKFEERENLPKPADEKLEVFCSICRWYFSKNTFKKHKKSCRPIIKSTQLERNGHVEISDGQVETSMVEEDRPIIEESAGQYSGKERAEDVVGEQLMSKDDSCEAIPVPQPVISTASTDLGAGAVEVESVKFSTLADSKFLKNLEESEANNLQDLIKVLNQIYKDQPEVLNRRIIRNEKEAPLVKMLSDHLAKKEGVAWDTPTLKEQSYLKKKSTASTMKGHFLRRILPFFRIKFSDPSVLLRITDSNFSSCLLYLKDVFDLNDKTGNYFV